MANHLPVDATSGVNQVLVDRKLARFPVAVRFRTGRAPGRWFGRHARFEALWARACRTWQAAGRVREARCRVHSRTTDEGGLVTLNPARPAKDLEDGTMAAETGFGNSHYRTRLDPELPAPGHKAGQYVRCQTTQPCRTLALCRLSQIAPYEAEQIDRAVRFGHIVITARGTRLVLVPLHGEGTHGNDWNHGKTRQRLDLPRRVIAIEHGQLDVHKHKIGEFRGRLDDALGAIHGLDYGITGCGEEIAQDSAQILLVLDDKNALPHVAPAAAARTGNSMRNVEP